MSNYILAIFAGVLQGLTEFLPISSSGHLILFHDIFKFSLPDDLLFDIVLHIGTLVALLTFFYQDIEKIIRGFLSSLTNWNLANNFNQRLAWLVVIGTMPAVIIGYFAEDIIETTFRSSALVATTLILGAIVIWFTDKYSTRQREVGQMNMRDALLVGLAQAVALIPGVSRSGSTIVAGLWLKLKREEAARFSFLLSAPVIFGAALKKMIGADWSDADMMLLLLGGLSSGLSGYFVVKYLIKYLSAHSLSVFVWYRVGLGLVVLIWLWVG